MLAPSPERFDHLARGRFTAILADPPWRFKSNSVANPGRNAMRHYSCPPVEQLYALPVGDLAAPDAALFLWITGPLLAIGAHLPLMKAWGFKPSGMGFVWIKLNPSHTGAQFTSADLATGGGFTTRKNAEFCLIGKRGRSVRRDAGVHEIIISPRREHSRKPTEIYRRIERYCAGPYLELFARTTRPGWTCWGNELGKFTTGATDGTKETEHAQRQRHEGQIKAIAAA